MTKVANRGLLRPPLVYLASTALGLVIHWVTPARIGPRLAGALVGSSLNLVGIAVLCYAIHTLRAAGTPVPGNRPTTAIVRTGPYRFSRNPIYLAFTAIQLGIAFWVNSPWLLVCVLFAIAVMTFVVIPREERYLEANFAAAYLPYKSRTQRWLGWPKDLSVS